MSKNGMTRYIIKRVLYMFLVLFIIMTMCFILIKLLPLPAVREMGRDINLVLAKREKMGYNKPIMVQYFLYLKSILTEWDWGVGEQMYEGMGVWDVMMQKLPYTVLVNLYSILIAIPLGLAFGIYAALKKNKWHGLHLGAKLCVRLPGAVLPVLQARLVPLAGGKFVTGRRVTVQLDDVRIADSGGAVAGLRRCGRLDALHPCGAERGADR